MWQGRWTACPGRWTGSATGRDSDGKESGATVQCHFPLVFWWAEERGTPALSAEILVGQVSWFPALRAEILVGQVSWFPALRAEMFPSVRRHKFAFFVINLRISFDFPRFRPNLADFIRIASSLHLFDVDFPPFDPKASTFRRGTPAGPPGSAPAYPRLPSRGV